MLVVMQQGAAEAQIQAVIDRMVGEGYDVHRSTGVMHTVLGCVGGNLDVDLEAFEGLGWGGGKGGQAGGGGAYRVLGGGGPVGVGAWGFSGELGEVGRAAVFEPLE